MENNTVLQRKKEYIVKQITSEFSGKLYNGRKIAEASVGFAENWKAVKGGRMGEMRGNGGKSHAMDTSQFWQIRCDGNQIFLFSNQTDTKYLEYNGLQNCLFSFFFKQLQKVKTRKCSLHLGTRVEFNPVL